MIGGNAADVYGFDLHTLAPLAAHLGPEVDMVWAGIDGIPETSSLANSNRGRPPYPEDGSDELTSSG